MVELLAPAGDLERLKVAFEYGADAVYLGGKHFSLRVRASNFEDEDIAEAVRYAHARGKKVYVTVNMIPHNSDFIGLEDYLRKLEEYGVDAIICASQAIMMLCKKVAPHLETHISTQQTTMNSYAIKYWENKGAERIVLGREVTLEQLKMIRANTSLPIEIFIHGGMCANYSGRCTISNLLTNRDANRGGCAQSCRWNYHLWHNDELLDYGDTLLSMGSKDMCCKDVFEDLLKADVASLKVEGRMKTAFYLACTIKAYRIMIDDFNEKGYISEEIRKQSDLLFKLVESRDTFAGFYPGIPDRSGQLYNNPTTAAQSFMANILDYDETTSMATIQVRNRFEIHDKLAILNPDENVCVFTVDQLFDLENNEVTVANKPLQVLKMKVPCRVNHFSFVVGKEDKK